jgi:hypothetical protein
MRGGLWGAALLLSVSAAHADCDHFKWSLAQEKAWFAAAPEPVETGAEIAPGARAYQVALKPEAAANFPLPPKKKTPGAFGAVVSLAALKPGLYQVTLSREAWVDAIQNNARARTRNVSRQRDCPTFAKSVRFQLESGPALLEFSGVAAPSLVFALAPAP